MGRRILGQTDPQRRGLIVALVAFVLLLGLWWLADGWYQAGLVAEAQGQDELAQRDREIFRWAGLVIVGLTTGLVYLTASRQRHLSQTVQSQIEALEQARQRLEQRVAARTQELETLLTISHDLTATLELKPLLTLILERAKEVVAYDQAALFKLNEESQLELSLAVGPVTIASHQNQLLLTDLPLYQQASQAGQPLVIDDVKADTEPARLWRETLGPAVANYAQTWLIVPLLFQRQAIGLLALGHSQPHYYTPRRVELAMAFANQAAVAMENARLYQQAQDLASLEERRHLARELHDSVSQALYGIALGTRTARLLLDRDPGQLAQPLDYIMNLAEAGLSEMRALIFELRPEILEAEGLVVALQKRAEALEARHKLRMLIELGQEPEISLAGKELLYRIAQEATHNIVKHAKASQVELRLFHHTGLTLEIRDDGQGFDPRQSFPGHLGLQSMRERADRLGGNFEIVSLPGHGTTVRVRMRAEAT